MSFGPCPPQAALTGIISGKIYHPFVYTSLLPIIGGVSLASVSEMSFNALAFGSAMLSNVGSATRGVFGKGDGG